MSWLLGGYVWLYIHRPFEFWPSLGDMQLERHYMLLTLLFWLICPGKGWVPNRLNLAFLGLIFALVVSWAVSPHQERGSLTVEDYFKVTVFYVLIMSTVRDEPGLRRLLVLYLGSMAVYMLHSLWEYHNGRSVYRMGITRMVGVDTSFGDPNTFSATLMYSLPLVMPFWNEPMPRWQRGLLVGYVGLSVLCVVLTGSRGGVIGLGFLSMLYLWRSKQHRWRFAALLLVALPVMWMMLPEDFQSRYTTLIDSEAGPASAHASAEGRKKGFIDGVNLWSRSPLTGFGPNSFGAAVGHGFQAHNLFGQTVGELGTLGLLALLGILFAFWRNGAEVRRLHRDNPWLSREFPTRVCEAVLVTVVLLLLLGLGGHNLYRYTWMWFGAFQAIALHCVRGRAATLSAEWQFAATRTPARFYVPRLNTA